MNRRISALSHVQVTAQFAGIVLSCYPVGLVNRGSAWWLALCLFGSVSGIWTLYHNRMGNFSVYPEPKTRTVLVTSGPYEYVRHPMYSALIIMMLGIVGYNGHWLNPVGLALVIVAVATKALREEKFLTARFPEYARYALARPRFIPFLPRPRMK